MDPFWFFSAFQNPCPSTFDKVISISAYILLIFVHICIALIFACTNYNVKIYFHNKIYLALKMWPLIYDLSKSWNTVSTDIRNKRNKNYLVHIEMIKHVTSATIWDRTLCTVLDSKTKARKIILMSLQESKCMTGGVCKDLQPARPVSSVSF